MQSYIKPLLVFSLKSTPRPQNFPYRWCTDTLKQKAVQKSWIEATDVGAFSIAHENSMTLEYLHMELLQYNCLNYNFLTKVDIGITSSNLKRNSFAKLHGSTITG